MVERARTLGELTARLQAALPAELGPSLVAANVRTDGRLVVIAGSPARAARLRFEADTLLAAARADGHAVESLVVRVSHDT